MHAIVTADDFGRSSAINHAVIRAHREGVLTHASLMVAGDAADEAIDLARQNPTLSVGLHLVVVDGPAVLPPQRLSHVVNKRGDFPDRPVRLGLRYAFSHAARRELRAEIAAQFERFAASGLVLSHVDGHQHMHMHPQVFNMLIPLARDHGAKRIRVVRDDLRLTLKCDRHHVIAKFVTTGIFSLLAQQCRGSGIPSLSRTYGFLMSGEMTVEYVLLVIQQMQETAELYFHPTVGERVDLKGPNPGDLAVLLNPAVKRAMAERRLLSAAHD